MEKISFIGDIMCEPLLLKAAKRRNTYDFSGVFEQVTGLFAESSYVVGNLETPLAGKKAGYVRSLFSFNAPDEFAQAVKAAGVNFISTANNHCMDRGIDGLKRTVDTLDRIGMAHDGTRNHPDNNPAPFIANVGELKVAIIPVTYGTNYLTHHNELPDKAYINLLHADTDPIFIPEKKGALSRVKGMLFKPFKPEQIAAIKKTLGMEYNKARKDDFLDEQRAAPYFEKLRVSICTAKKSADLVVFYPHVGGQFNAEPGAFTEYTVKKALEFGADAVVASHPHVIQKAVAAKNAPVFYSIGNFSMSPNSVYLLHDNLPEYGLMVHLYIEERQIVRTAFSILKMVEEKGKMLTVWPVDKLKEPCKEDIRRIYRTVTGKDLTGETVRHEYEL